ncbi:MAG: hypothetical protein HYS17_05310 [Micavibrio aeruginosavorus]|uniref:Biotin-protein ligase N-terminal domain-containing protein n=1 Tax=Micavibrio aeruginosavorus TaxID=349221 RepID=A0A7T5R4B3_9BACT|nr:MAG: hypothetical protein HYS17_05310 [Micavibrio aeruginosavorus]
MKFPVYSERPANTESVIPPLKDIFKGTGINVCVFDSGDLRNGILREPDTVGFSLPGIIGEVSGYTDQIGEAGLQEMSAAIRPGRIMLAVCAGAYFPHRQTIYDPQWGPKRNRAPLNHLIKGVARGPVADMGGQYDPSLWPSDLSLCDVWYKTAGSTRLDSTWQRASIAYGNGPAFYPDNPHDPNLEPLAFYAAVPGKPLAAASLQHGAGKILMLGVLPHIGYRDIPQLEGFAKVRQLMEDLKAHEAPRQDFQRLIGERLKDQIHTYCCLNDL